MLGFTVLERLNDKCKVIVEVCERLKGGGGGLGEGEGWWLDGKRDVINCGRGRVGGCSRVEVQCVGEGEGGKWEAVGQY